MVNIQSATAEIRRGKNEERRRQAGAPPVPNAPSSRICGQNPRNDADATFQDPHISVVDCCCSAGTPLVLTQHATIGGRLPEWQTSKCISSVSCVRIESKYFCNTQETQTQKMMDQNFEIRILWPIWTIMVTAKLDQSRVLVTTFHQNRSTLKGTSAGQRHADTQTHRQTDRQTHRQTRLKIVALQVCNRANTHTSRWVFTARLRPQFRTPPVPNAPERRS